MSIWTHVLATFRIDSVTHNGTSLFPNDGDEPYWDEIVGKETPEADWALNSDWRAYQQWQAVWDEYDEHPERFLPTGDEGSLRRTVQTYTGGDFASCYVITVFGDLRDYSDSEAVRKWFEGVCKRCNVRQATCACEVEGMERWTITHVPTLEQTLGYPEGDRAKRPFDSDVQEGGAK